MAEAGCKVDGSFQNMEIAGRTEMSGVVNITAGSFANGALETTYATAARTALSASTGAALTKNTHHTMPGTNSAALTLPAQADSVKGDFITLLLTGVVADGQTLKIGTGGEFFTVGSKVYVKGQDATRTHVVDYADGSGDDFFNITGKTNGDGGIGTSIDLYFNGSTWSLDATVLGQGTMAVASATTGFATS